MRCLASPSTTSFSALLPLAHGDEVPSMTILYTCAEDAFSLDAGTRNVEQPPLRGGAAARRYSNLFLKAGLLYTGIQPRNVWRGLRTLSSPADTQQLPSEPEGGEGAGGSHSVHCWGCV